MVNTKKILYINCCIRNENSRTEKIASKFLEVIKEKDNILLEEIKLSNLKLDCMLYEKYIYRKSLLENGDLSNEFFNYAHQFKNADYIIISAPFWDLCFPAILKVYIETISVSGITFLDTSTGIKGNCNAKKLMYISTRGSVLGKESSLDIGNQYLKSLCKMYGIPNYDCIVAEGLDLPDISVKSILDNVYKECIQKAKDFI